MRYSVLFPVLLLFFVQSAHAGEKCAAGEIPTTIKLGFTFDRVDLFAGSETDTATINLFPATKQYKICYKPELEVWIREANAGKWFEVRFDENGKKVGLYVP